MLELYVFAGDFGEAFVWEIEFLVGLVGADGGEKIGELWAGGFDVDFEEGGAENFDGELVGEVF